MVYQTVLFTIIGTMVSTEVQRSTEYGRNWWNILF